ncbi:MAG: hypothetical protein KC493_11730 [Bacteriovoracaceae bacterium]|nr:hypothetical protein [Bacteriovoracaceae bacterium]
MMTFFLVIAIFFSISSCSSKSKKKNEELPLNITDDVDTSKESTENVEKVPETVTVEREKGLPIVEAIPQWLNVDRRFSPRDREGDPLIHAFFDFLPFPELKDKKINFVALTPVKSKFAYSLDLHSGQIYKKFNMCNQKDVWKSYRGSLSSVPYTEGFVPRMLDQLGEPLKIVVFGNLRYLASFDPKTPVSQRVRVVGGVIEQYCEYYPCAFRNQWQSRLVLVGVNHKDPKFEKIDSLTDLKKTIKWSKFKAYMENMGGRLIRGKEQKPAYRISGSINANDAFNYALKKGHHFKFDELAKLRKGCHKLYDHMWRGAEKLRKNIKHGRSTRNTSKLRSESLVVDIKKSIFKDKKKSNDGDEKLSGPVEGFTDFEDYFMDFYKNYSKRYLTCHRFVRVSSVRGNIDRHWFFAFMTSFLELERIGFTYHCPKRAWLANPYLANGKRQFDLIRMKKSCRSEDLERAFDGSITILQGLRKSLMPHYFYKQYDDGIGSTHQRIYSWIYSTGKMPACKAELKKLNSEIGFPVDVNWKPFHPYTLDI